MSAKPFSADVLRAAKLSRVPGVTLDEACKRFKVAKSAVQRARRSGAVEERLSLEDLALAALTDNGNRESGKLDGLAKIAEWLSYVDQSAYGEDDVRKLLEKCVAIDGAQWRLLKPWP
ncbi:MAG: hypothetical protein JST54_13915 [Deltaproteobacteria bacterium]|nr:hypothetical protein [Deltaproteobacteria bacterium]